MNTTLEEKAADVWSMMYNHAMPARLAVEFLQESAGDRQKAVAVLITAAVVFSAGDRPSAHQLAGGTANDAEAGLVGGAILLGKFDAAARHRSALANRLVKDEIAGDASAGPWLDWCEKAARVIELCRAVAAEATAPEAAK